MPSTIAQLFTVTFTDRSTSLYRVNADPDAGFPHATKLALIGQSGVQVGEILGNRPMLAVCSKLIWYDPGEVRRDLNGTDRKGWGACSSWVAGVFLSEEAARKCFGDSGHTIGDTRYVDETFEVINAVGEDHPMISFPSSVDFGLIESTSPRI